MSLDELAQQLKILRHEKNPEPLWSQIAYGGLSKKSQSEYQQQNFQLYSGKVREMVARPDDILMIHTDRLSAFDRYISLVPGKGIILAAINEFWFGLLHKNKITTHYLERTDARTLRVMKTKPIKAEVVVRGYLAGSMLRAYQKGERSFCGVTLPEGLSPYQKLSQPIITPTTKAAAFEHDENISTKDLVNAGVCTEKEWADIESQSLKIFGIGQTVLHKIGWMLADTKYEFGKLPSGEIILIDEVHTPDSSRFWNAANYDARLAQGEAPVMFDKENIRRYLISQNFSGIGEVPAVPPNLLLDLAETYLFVAKNLN